jgi:hypothetical protein
VLVEHGGSQVHERVHALGTGEQPAHAARAEKVACRGWYNCNGCYANGGGGSGPALMDDLWIYGSAAANVVATILEGRPNVMLSFRSKIPDYQAMQLAAYVRLMSGLRCGPRQRLNRVCNPCPAARVVASAARCPGGARLSAFKRIAIS